jgi:CBS domain-containing protein
VSRSLLLFLTFDDYRSGNLVRSEYNQIQVPLTVLRLSVGRLPLYQIGVAALSLWITTCPVGLSRGQMAFIYRQRGRKIMSGDRYERDDNERGAYGGGNARRRGGAFDDRYGGGGERSDYRRDSSSSSSGGGGYRERDYGYDDPYRAQRRRGGGYSGGGGLERGDYGRGGYNDHADYRDDERRYGDYRVEREDDDRSWFDEGREYLRRSLGGGRDQRPRGRSRSRLRCRDIMTRDVTVATRDTSLQEVAAMMREEDTGVIPVVDREDSPALAGEAALAETPRINNRMRGNGKLVGLITDRDIVVRAVAEGKDDKTTRAEEVMTTDLHTAHPNDRVIDVIRKMGDKQVRRIPVVGENGQLRGIISMADIALETEEDEELADAIEEISSGASFWGKVFG